MRLTSHPLLIAGLLCLVRRSRAAPGRTTDEVLLGEVDIALQNNILEITTEEPFKKKCVVDEKLYSHGQTIPSYDQNSHCLCVAGEVYCWWQSYRSSSTDSSPIIPPASWTTEENFFLLHHESSSTDSTDTIEASGEPLEEFTVEKVKGSEGNVTSTSETPKTCNVMGREYQEGETLPHSTGNCVECSCGTEGRIECSPRDCIPLRSQIVPDIPEAPDGDFEMFDLDHDRGMEGNF